MMCGVVKVKVCGITREADAVLASDLGASAVGFVFWTQSPRFITPTAAGAIARALPADVAPVGVFVNPTAGELQEAVRDAGLAAVQLHGDEPAAWCGGLPYRVLKAVPVDGSSSMETALAWSTRVTLLLDVHDPVRRGGTGQVVDWTVAASIARRRRVFLAGGLTPGNVATAVTAVRPYAVDVSSGVEAAPGVKDAARLRAFFQALVSAGTVGGAASGDPRGGPVEESRR